MEREQFISQCKNIVLERSVRRRENGKHDSLYAVLLSETGSIYVGKPFTLTQQPQFHFCAERHAINQMIIEESEDAGIERILVAHPVPEDDDTPCYPCGACRDALCRFDDVEVISTSYVREEKGWELFGSLDINCASELNPKQYDNPWKE